MILRRWSSWKLGSCKLVSWKKPDARVLTFNFPMVARTLKMKQDVTAAMWVATRPGRNISSYVIIIHANITIANNSCTHILYIIHIYVYVQYKPLREIVRKFLFLPRELLVISIQVITSKYILVLRYYSISIPLFFFILYSDYIRVHVSRRRKKNS